MQFPDSPWGVAFKNVGMRGRVHFRAALLPEKRGLRSQDQGPSTSVTPNTYKIKRKIIYKSTSIEIVTTTSPAISE